MNDLPLGKTTAYKENYDSTLLFPIRRERNKGALMYGADIWNAYELSWLNPKGKPCVASIEMSFPCTSPNLIESKSLKLYFNSFNQTGFESTEVVLKTIAGDLEKASGSAVTVSLIEEPAIGVFQGTLLDDLDIEVDTYTPTPSFLKAEGKKMEETLVSHLLKSNCPVTHQPDWASIMIVYQGHGFDHEGLLKYLISFRQHDDFHEVCIERIFQDIMKMCKPEKLFVYARYTRRGGLDINPYRSTENIALPNVRLERQ